MLWVMLYALTIVGANFAISEWGFVPVGFGLMAPAGVYAAGLAFGIRDAIHERLGTKWVLIAIVFGAVLSYAISPTFALASGIAFSASELSDFLVYAQIRKRSKIVGVLVSNTVGLVADSLMFLYLAFGSVAYWQGQVVGKAWITLATVAILVVARWYKYAESKRVTASVS